MDRDPQHALARWRRVAGLSQHDLAYRAGVHRVTIANLERGRQPLVRTALKIAETLRGDEGDIDCRVEDIWPLDPHNLPVLEAAERAYRSWLEQD